MKRIEVGNLLSPSVLVSPTTPVSKVVGILKDLDAYEAFIEDNKKIWMLTTRDILRTSNITMEKAISLASSIPKLSPRSTIAEAARLLMEYRIRALPVVEDNNFVGVVQAISIINATKESIFSKVEAKNIMTAKPLTLGKDELTSKARSVMIRKKIDHVPVLAENKLCGVLLSSHIVFNMFQATEMLDRDTMLSEEQRRLEFPVKHLVDSNPLTSRVNDKISLIFEEMMKQKTTYSIITLWEEIQGIITYRDYMKLLAEQLKILEVPSYIIGLPEDPFEAEMAKSKFVNAIKSLRRLYPFIEEAKAVIKTFDEGDKQRRRYEVTVTIIIPKRSCSYSENGWELPKIFDAISTKLKRVISQKYSKRNAEEEGGNL